MSARLAALSLLILLAGCSGDGSLPRSNSLSYAANDPSAARNAADICATYGQKAVPDGTTDGAAVVRFTCK
jgi:hypothetical protein